MKKLLLIVVTISLCMLVGCSSSSTSSSTSSASATSSSAVASGSTAATSSLFAVGEWPETRAVEKVPKPTFSKAPESIQTTMEQSAMVDYKGLNDEEVSEYVSQLKAAGFTHNVNETKSQIMYIYSAWDSEESLHGTQVSLTYTFASQEAPSRLLLTALNSEAI